MRIQHVKKLVSNDLPIIKQCLKKFYGIGNIELIKDSSWNIHLRGIDRKGQIFFVKVINDLVGAYKQTKLHLEWSMKYLYKLISDLNFQSAVVPVSGSDGKIVRSCENWKLLVFLWIDNNSHNQISESRPQIIETIEKGAKLLADTHRYQDKIENVPEIEFSHPFTYSPKKWKEELNNLFNTSFSYLRNEEGISSEVLNKLEDIFIYSRNFVENSINIIEEGQKRMLHGDFRPENILIGSSGHWFVTDFDMMHFGYREKDVIYSALCFSGKAWLYGARDWNKYYNFIDYYSFYSNSSFSHKRMSLMLRWVVLRSILLSYKSEQVIKRIQLFESIPK